MIKNLIMTANLMRDDVASIIANEVMRINNAKPLTTDRVIFFDLSVRVEEYLGVYTVYRQTLLFSTKKKKSWKVTIHHSRSDDLDDEWELNYVQNKGTDEFFITLKYDCRDLIYKFNAKDGDLSYFSSSDDGVTYNDETKEANFQSYDDVRYPLMCVNVKTFVNKKKELIS